MKTSDKLVIVGYGVLFTVSILAVAITHISV